MRIILIGEDRLVNRHIEIILEKEYGISVSTQHNLSSAKLDDFDMLLIHVSKKTIREALPLVSHFQSRELPVLILSTSGPFSFVEFNRKKLAWLEIPFVESTLLAKVKGI